jgi:hypothetical protein
MITRNKTIFCALKVHVVCIFYEAETNFINVHVYICRRKLMFYKTVFSKFENNLHILEIHMFMGSKEVRLHMAIVTRIEYLDYSFFGALLS